jgi:GNAT acetyltransferase-like protein
VYTTSEMRMIKLASGRLLLPPGDHCLDCLFASLDKRYPDRPVVKIEKIPRPGPLNDYLHTSARIRERYFLHAVPGDHRVHTIPLPSSYEQFLARYGAKKRYNLRRQLRLLQVQTAGKLAMSRYNSIGDIQDLASDIAVLLRACGRIAAWLDRNRKSFEAHHWRLASVGLLRSYVLKDAEHPIAYILGYQFGETFLLGEIEHDRAYAEFSPGTALLQMVIEDLINDGRIRLINLGIGVPKHDYPSTNVLLDYVSYWLIPKTWKRRLFQAGYTAFRCGVALMKSALPLPPRE